MDLSTTLLGEFTPKADVVIPDVITLTREQVMELDHAWEKQKEFCTRVLGLVLVKGRDVTVSYAGYEEVFTLERARRGAAGWYTIVIATIIEKIRNGGKTNDQIAVEEAARKIADILTRERLA